MSNSSDKYANLKDYVKRIVESGETVLDLSDPMEWMTNLDPETIDYLIEIIKQGACFSRVTELNLARKHIRDDVCQKLSEALEGNTTILKLNMSQASLQKNAMNYIQKMLSENTALEYLDLSRNNFSKTGIEQLFNNLHKNHTLKVLKLSGNAIGGELKALSENLKQNSSLTALILDHNYIGETTSKYLIPILQNPELNIKYLNVANNYIYTQSMKNIAKGLKKNQTLTQLNISGSNGSEGLNAIFKRLLDHKAIKTLELSKLRLDVSFSQLINTNHNIKKLDLSGSTIFPETLLKICEDEQFAIETLNLGGCDYGDSFCQIISEKLKFCSTLKELILYDNNLSDSGVKLLCEFLNYNKSITKLDLSSNHISDEGCIYLNGTLRYHNDTLRYLNLGTNKYKDEGAKLLAESMKTNYSILEFAITFPYYTSKGVKQIMNSRLQRNREFFEKYQEFLTENSIEKIEELDVFLGVKQDSSKVLRFVGHPFARAKRMEDLEIMFLKNIHTEME